MIKAYSGEREARDIQAYFSDEMDIHSEYVGHLEDEVVRLTDANYEELVMNSNDVWMVEFYAPWCGFCKSLAPEYKIAAKHLLGKVKLGKVDCTKELELKSRYKIDGFPTLKVF